MHSDSAIMVIDAARGIEAREFTRSVRPIETLIGKGAFATLPLATDFRIVILTPATPGAPRPWTANQTSFPPALFELGALARTAFRTVGEIEWPDAALEPALRKLKAMNDGCPHFHREYAIS